MSPGGPDVEKVFFVDFQKKNAIGAISEKHIFGDFQENEFLRETLFFHVPGGVPTSKKCFLMVF